MFRGRLVRLLRLLYRDGRLLRQLRLLRLLRLLYRDGQLLRLLRLRRRLLLRHRRQLFSLRLLNRMHHRRLLRVGRLQQQSLIQIVHRRRLV